MLGCECKSRTCPTFICAAMLNLCSNMCATMDMHAMVAAMLQQCVWDTLMNVGMSMKTQLLCLMHASTGDASNVCTQEALYGVHAQGEYLNVL